MRKLFRFLGSYWPVLAIMALYVCSFGSLLIEPNKLNCLLCLLLSGIAIFAIIKAIYKK